MALSELFKRQNMDIGKMKGAACVNPGYIEEGCTLSGLLKPRSRALSMGPLRGCAFIYFVLVGASLTQCGTGQNLTGSLRSDIAALLAFKAGLADPKNKLSSWNAANPNAPCNWRGVTCFAGRVFEVHLPRMNLQGSIADLGQLGALNTLSLHSNGFNGSIPFSISNASNLRAIYLNNNAFEGEIPPVIGAIQPLQVLNLANNKLIGGIPLDLGKLKSLKNLDLSINSLSGAIPSQLSNCTRLLYINLSRNNLTGVIPAALGELSALISLSLNINQLTGAIPPSIGNCSSLVGLNLERNSLSGSIPNTLGRIPTLQNLLLGVNRLTGNIPPGLSNISTLVVLSLQENALSGPIPSSFGAFKLLRSLNLSQNSLSSNIPPQVSECTSLQVLDLQFNTLNGAIPSELGLLENLQVLLLGNNNLSSRIPPQLGTLSQLSNLSLSVNNITGSIPSELLNCINLQVLSLQGNRISGELPTLWGSLKRLETLNLRGNNLSGPLPQSIVDSSSLKVLDLSNQQLSGNIPEDISKLTNLQLLSLSNNRISGKIPSSLGKLQQLLVLSLSYNPLSGGIPSEIGNCSKLDVLELSHDNLQGQIPPDLGYLLQLQNLDLEGNKLSGNIPETLVGCRNLAYLHLGGNELSGPIPTGLGLLKKLQQVRLEKNHLSGNIPSSFGGLSRLHVLDLSVNKLTGTIPASLGKIGSLTSFNVSNNGLQGQIPSPLSGRFGASSFAGNPLLCGRPLNRLCEGKKKKLAKRAVIVIAVTAGAGVLFLAVIIACLVLLCARKGVEVASREDVGSPENLVMFYGPIPYAKVVEATRQFDEDHVLSRTRYGIVFKACLQDGTVLSVKRLPDGAIEENVFRTEAENLGRLKHKNLLVLRGYYYSADVKLLIYDYMPNGNLAVLLQQANHQDGNILDWRMRHLIALNIARGLQFLHVQCDPPVVHGDVRPHNVQFDADFEPHLSDFGVEKLSVTPVDPSTSSSSTPAGPLGYTAPEASSTGQTTRESDVYSFGILLLELLTGRKPAAFTQDEDIVKWVKRQLQARQISEMFDPSLLELFDQESSEWEEFLLAVKVALLCTGPDPTDRPSMTEVVFMLEGCRTGGAEMHTSSSDPTSYTSPVSAL